jgi:CRP-like cAMP-binding protein
MAAAKAKLTPSELRANRFFVDFSEREITELLRVCDVHAFKPGETVLREKDVSRDVFVVLAGTVRIGKALYAGDEKEFGSLGPGEFFGEMAFLDGGPRSANVSCVEESTVLRIDRNSFEKLAARRPGIGYKVTMKIACALAERLRASNDVVEDFFSNPNKAIVEFKTRLLKIQTMLMRR